MTAQRPDDLHAQMLRLATETISTEGIHALSLRDVARRAGVSHAAPVHHFGSKTGLLTELACDGYESLDADLRRTGGDLYDRGVAYVRWGVENPGLYTVMWQTGLLDLTNPRLLSARQATWTHLSAAGASGQQRTDALAAFALVHGIVSLAIDGSDPAPPLDEPGLRDLLRRLSPPGTA